MISSKFAIFSFSGTRVLDNVQRTNTIYGGVNPAVTNIIFTHGSNDPWRAMGIQKDLHSTAKAIIINGES